MISVPIKLYSPPTEYMYETMNNFKEAMQSFGYIFEQDFYMSHDKIYSYDRINETINTTMHIHNYALLYDKKVREFLLEYII